MNTRKTKQGSVLQNILQSGNTPLSADEIWGRGKSIAPSLGMATVYRYIARGQREGRITAVEIPGHPPRYELTGKSHHHHFVCEFCGGVFELPGCVSGMESYLPRGFRARRHELAIFGTCNLCA